MERCLQEGNEKIDEDLVKDLVGIPKLTFVSRIMQAIIEYHVEDVLKTVEEVNNEGKDLQNLLWELIKYAKDILVFKTCGKLEIYNEEELKQINALSKQISKERLLQIIYTLSQLENDMKWSSQKTVLFEVAMIKLCHSEESSKGTGLEDIVQRLNMLEDKINSGKIAVKIDSSSEQIQNGTSQNAENSKKQVKINPNIGKVGIEQVNNVQVEKLPFWPKVIEELKQQRKMLLASNLLNTVATMLNDMTVGIVFQGGLTPFVKSIMEKPRKYSRINKTCIYRMWKRNEN